MRSQRLAVAGVRPDPAVVEPRAEEISKDDAVAGVDDVVDQHPRPGRADIKLIRVARGVERGADRRARLQGPTQPRRRTDDQVVADRRLPDQLRIDVGAVLLAAQGKHVMVPNAELHLGIGNVLRVRACRIERGCDDRDRHREPVPDAYFGLVRAAPAASVHRSTTKDLNWPRQRLRLENQSIETPRRWLAHALLHIRNGTGWLMPRGAALPVRPSRRSTCGTTVRALRAPRVGYDDYGCPSNARRAAVEHNRAAAAPARAPAGTTACRRRAASARRASGGCCGPI